MASWKNKVVVIAGGSSGLGFAIAKAFHRENATVVLLARNTERLQTAVERLQQSRQGDALGFPVDLLNKADLAAKVEQIVDSQKQIDVWVNAVGQSTRIEFGKATDELYRELMEQNFYSALNGTQAALGAVTKSSGHVVNIGSLASRTAWPYVSPYVASKHALAGFASQLRLEGPDNVHFLFVCPGPIASEPAEHGETADSTAKRYEVTGGMSEMAAQPGAGAPTKLIDPNWLAEKIVDACRKRKPELVVPAKSRILFGLLQWWPRAGNALLKRISKSKRKSKA